MKEYVVYMHKNKINNKVYIGQTCNIKKRWAPQAYQGSTYFYHAICKYGWKNFQHIILQSQLNKQQADKKEIEMIAKYNSTNQKYGYNISIGGGIFPNTSGKNNPFYGKHHSKQSLKIMKDKKYGGKNPMAKAVRCLNTQEVFPSCREASDWCGIARQNIQRCCRGGRPTAGKHPITKEKLKWRYLEDEI